MTARAEFDALLSDHRVVPVIRELFADAETPVGIYRKLAKGAPGTFLLESAEQGGIWSRYSFIGVSSFGVLSQINDTPCWLDYGMSEHRAVGDLGSLTPLEAIERLHSRWATAAHGRARRVCGLGCGTADREASRWASRRFPHPRSSPEFCSRTGGC